MINQIGQLVKHLDVMLTYISCIKYSVQFTQQVEIKKSETASAVEPEKKKNSAGAVSAT